MEQKRTELYPSIFNPLSELSEPVRALVEPLYKSPDYVMNIIASLINHAATARTPLVMSSNRIFEDCMNLDPNHKYPKALNPRMCSSTKHYMIKSQMFIVMKSSVRGRRVAGLVQLSADLCKQLEFTDEEWAVALDKANSNKKWKQQ